MFDAPAPQSPTTITTTAARLFQLCKQLAPASRGRKRAVPVLSCALIQAGPDGTTLTTTDLDLTIRIHADDLISPEPWQACVSFGLLSSIARSMDGPLCLIHVKGVDESHMDRLTIADDDGTTASVNLIIPATDFPALPDGLDATTDWHVIPMAPADLRRAIDLAAPCVSTEETRYFLNGIHLCQKPDGTTLRCVATDGRRAAIIDTACTLSEPVAAIMPTIAVRAIQHLVDKRGNEQATLMLHRTAHRMRLIHGPMTIDCKMIDGTFPDYTKVIPKAETRTSVTVTAAALRRLNPMHHATDHRATVFRAGRMICQNPEFGEISAPAPMLHYPRPDAPPVEEIGFNLSYLLTQAHLTPTFRLDLTAAKDPARIHGEDPAAMWLLMPMRAQ